MSPNLTNVLTVGYNGQPAGLPNNRCRGTPGTCGCIHSEANALVKLREPASRSSDLLLLCTHSPCEHCAGLVLNSACIGYVLFAGAYRLSTGLQILQAGGIVTVSWMLLGEKFASLEEKGEAEWLELAAIEPVNEEPQPS